MLDILGLIMPLFGLIILGFIAARATRQPAEALGWLTTFVIYFALPALFFSLISKTPIEKLANGDFILVNLGATFAIFVACFLLGLLFSRGDGAQATLQGLAGAYGNIGYMGPAIAILALGEQAAIPVALIFCFENVMHFTLAPALMAATGRGRGDPARLAAQVARSIAAHPFIIATALGVAAAFFRVDPPAPVERLIDYLAQAAAPCALFALGVTLGLRPLRRPPAALAYLAPLKLLLHPALMYLALSWFGDFDPVWVYTAVLVASLPTAANVFVIAQQYEVWVEEASSSVLLTTSLSVFTVALALFLIGGGLLPPDLFPAAP